ncbi:unnamed protein product, partial [Eruca vesicaria subsp. sativa]|nr:unnamed protein product [Eruca vesicaria subsp. sativa]
MRKYPWGLHSFNMLVSSIIDARNKVKTKKSYVIDGFSYALQIWAMEAIPDIGTLLGQKLEQGVMSMICRNWKESCRISFEDISSLESDFTSTGVLFPSIASNGTFSDVIVQAEFAQAGEMNDERVDLIIDMNPNNYDWSKHVWAYHEPRHSYVPSSGEENTEAEEDVETSENEMEEETESAAAPVERKRKKIVSRYWCSVKEE